MPKDNDFFNRYATLTPTLYKLGFFAQLVSAFTEFGIIYNLVYSSLADFWPEYAPTAATTGAIIGTAFLEVGLRKFLPYSCQAVLYRRFRGLDLLMTVFILLATVALLATSGVLSFQGSKTMVAAVAPAADQKTTAAADTAYKAGRVIALQTYQADSAEIVTRYASQAAAITTACKSQIGAKETEWKNLAAREAATGENYFSQKAKVKQGKADLEAERDGKLAALEIDKGRELSEAATRRKTALEAANLEYSARKDSVSTFNALSVAKIDNQVSAYGGGMAWFTVICLFVLVVSIILNEAHRKGSGIEEKVVPSQYDFSAPIFADFLNATGNKMQQWFRAAIRRIEENTPPPPLPLAPNELYSLENLQQPVFRVNFDEIPEAYKDILIAARPAPSAPTANWKQTPQSGDKINPGIDEIDGVPALLYLEAARKFQAMGHPALAREQELKAEQVLKMYLGQDGTPAAVEQLKKACIDYLDGKGPNPFEHHHRRQIGFSLNENKAGPEVEKSKDLTTIVNAGKQEEGERVVYVDKNSVPCTQCSKLFLPKNKRHKFCSDPCRLDHHAAQHGGQAFNPNYKPWKGGGDKSLLVLRSNRWDPLVTHTRKNLEGGGKCK